MHMIHKIHMAHITLSIPDDLYREIKKHPHIKWSQAAREGIKQQLSQLGGVISGKDFLKRLNPETRRALERVSNLPKSDWKKYHKKLKESEKRRLKSLTQTS